jgi:hypothetical protein
MEELCVTFRRETKRRKGAALVESALVSTLFATVIFGMIDVGIALFRKHVVSEAARQGARAAIVHGYFAPVDSTISAWGPSPSYYTPLSVPSVYAGSTCSTVNANDPGDELAAAIRPYLIGLDPSTILIQIAWPDGNNEPGSNVTVTVSTPYRHIVPMVFGTDAITLGASSTMTIAH